MIPDRTNPVAISLPYRFDTGDVWRKILKGAVAFNALLLLCVIAASFMRPWPVTIGLAISESMAFWFTRLLFKHQEGSIGTLNRDRIDVEPSVVLGISLPGACGSYPLDRFSAIQVEFRTGPIEPGVPGGPNEVVWLKGKAGTPNIALAHVEGGAGRAVGKQLAAALSLPVEEIGAPMIRLQL